jgi:hypothetical protein
MHRPAFRLSLRVAILISFASSAALAGDDIRVERVRFAHGASSAVVEGSITGDQTVDYVLGARKGQTASISMATENGANYFNILAPGENEAAFFNGSTGDNQFEGVLPESGDYKIRVYLMRSAARRNERASYRLEMSVTGAGEHAEKAHGGAPPGDALVPGTSYHATGNVPCSMGGGQPTGSCPFGVKREGGGSATVTVTKPDGRTRAIVFEKGKAVGYDQSQADPGELRASREGDLSVIRIGDERYEIPDAVVFGG